MIPLVHAFAAAFFDGVKAGRRAWLVVVFDIFIVLVVLVLILMIVFITAGVDVYTGEECLGLMFGEFAQNPHRIFTFNFIARMHETIGELAVGGENQQA